MHNFKAVIKFHEEQFRWSSEPFTIHEEIQKK